MTYPKEAFEQLKIGYLRLYCFILFAYHLRMYKNAVKNALAPMLVLHKKKVRDQPLRSHEP